MITGLFVGFNKVNAQSFTESFENFKPGSIGGQHGWDGSAAVTSTIAYDGTQSIRLSYADDELYLRKKKLEELDNPEICLWWDDTGEGDIEIGFDYNDIVIDVSKGKIQIHTPNGWQQVGSYTENHNHWIHVCSEHSNVNQERVRIGNNPWTPWTTSSANVTTSAAVKISSYKTNPEYIDMIERGSPWETQRPTIQLNYPPEGTTTAITSGDFRVSGYYSYDPEDPMAHWTSIQLFFRNRIASSSSYRFSTSTTVTATGHFSIPVQIDATGTYDIIPYFVGEKVVQTNYITSLGLLSQQFISKPIFSTTTVVIGSSYLQPWMQIVQPQLYTEPEPQKGTLDHLLWSVKRFIQGLVIPSPEAQNLFIQRVSGFQNRFPANYIRLSIKFFKNLNITPQNPKISILGTEYQPSLLNPYVRIGETTDTLADYFLIFSRILLIGIFLSYLLFFVKRIF